MILVFSSGENSATSSNRLYNNSSHTTHGREREIDAPLSEDLPYLTAQLTLLLGAV